MASPRSISDEKSKPAGRFTIRSQWMVIYALLTGLVLLLAVFLAARGGTPLEPAPPMQAGPTASTSATVTLTDRPTLTSTPRPTFTPQPTDTATITPSPTETPTSTPLPSLTPAFPLADDDDYHLVDWTEEIAGRGINLLEAYPDTLSNFAQGELGEGYYAAFRFAIFAQREALLQFPSAALADDWQWRLAYNLARTGDPSAAGAFANLLKDALNGGRVKIDELKAWGAARRPEVLLEITPVVPKPGYLSNSIIKVGAPSKGGPENGAAVLWALEKPDKFEIFPLTNDFDFIHATEVNSFSADLTGDGNPEIVVFRSATPGSSIYPLPRVFDLSFQPPVELFFDPHRPTEIGPDFRNHWSPVEPSEQSGDLQFISNIFPACPVTVQHIYEWNGRSFEFLEEAYSVEPAPHLLDFCNLVMEHSANAWGPRATIHLMETLIAEWPPEVTSQGDPYPQEALDEWRYRLGLYHALLGQKEQAEGYFIGITSNPAAPDSNWEAQAREFLDTYQNQRDIYRACMLSSHCLPDTALQSLVSTFSNEDYSSAPAILQEAGVSLRSSGFFDFDKDGASERWIILRHHPQGKLEFWILTQSPAGVKALFVREMDTPLPQLSHIESTLDPIVVRLAPDLTFSLRRDAKTQEPFIEPINLVTTFSVNLTQQELDRLGDELLSGSEPNQILRELAVLKGSSIFTCNYQTCPQYLYTLGLAHELGGNPRSAVEAYLELWRQYPRHPYTTLARLKLSGEAVPPSPTATALPTWTETPTATATITGTLPTSTPTETPTPSPTAEESETPSPTPTP